MFTAALVLVSRVLWAQRPGDSATDTVAESCRAHLVKAAEALHHLDKGNTMVAKCRDYIRYLLRLCDTYCKYFSAMARMDYGADIPAVFEVGRPGESGIQNEGRGLNTLHSWDQHDDGFEQLFTSELFNDPLFLDLDFAPGEDSVIFSGYGN